jgi:N-acetylglucosamine-6-phosphate deacetylase
MITKIINGRVITDGKEINNSLYINDKKIMAITNDELHYDILIDAKNNYISAGFIDIHTHGGAGYDFMDGGVLPILEAAKLHLKHGTTSIMPTTLTSSWEVLKNSLEDIKKAMEKNPNIIGVHLEGPYFSHNQCGAQNTKYMVPIKKEQYAEILKLGDGIIKRWSFAPELDGSEEFCDFLVENGVVPSIAHSDATYEDVCRVYKKGCKLVTHLYSGMSTIVRVNGFRKLGVVESTYLLDDMIAEVIADGIHLPPELLMLIYKLKGDDNICLVTDSMRGAGMPNGLSMLGRKEEGLPCIIEDNVAKLMDRSAFAGSVATADRLVRTYVKDVGISVASTVKMITENPAKILNLANKGKIKEGYDADVIIFDEKINIQMVMSLGNIVKE